jgi:hypothetical protein
MNMNTTKANKFLLPALALMAGVHQAAAQSPGITSFSQNGLLARSNLQKNSTMNQKLKFLALFVTAVAVFLAVPGALHAQVSEKMSISAIIYLQGATSDKKGVTTIAGPSKQSVSTVNLLESLAKDENAEGNYSNTRFPSTAVLHYYGDGFEVDEGTNVLVDVSDILNLTVTGQNDITNGNYTEVNGPGKPPYTQTAYQIVTLAYTSNTGASGLGFTVTGLGEFTQKAGTPTAKTGKFTQSDSFSLQDGTGEGALEGVEFVITGFTVTASGSAAEN